MQIVIDQADFRRLSPKTQREIIEQLAGRDLAQTTRRGRGTHLYWRRPVDLSPDLAVKFVHGLAEPHRKRLELLASKDGRATMKDLLAVTGDKDWRILSYFQSVLTRRLRRLIEDPERKAELIKWDFDSTKWDSERTAIVDGVYYVSPATAAALRRVLKPAGPDRAETALR
jgi:hypothetical protein